jgi:MFS family permease
LLIAIYDLAEIVAKPLFRMLADRKGMKPKMLAGIVVFTLAYGLYNAVKGAGYVVSPVIGGVIVWKSHLLRSPPICGGASRMAELPPALRPLIPSVWNRMPTICRPVHRTALSILQHD